MMRELVVVADDLGASPGSNRGIFRAHREGIVSAASLLVGMPTSTGAACGAAEQGLPLGLHFRLSAGQPMSEGPRQVGLADENGFFALPRVVLRLAAGGDGLAEALRAELRAQMSAFLALVPSPDYINSHHHLHLHPALLGPFLEEAREMGFSCVRWPVEEGAGTSNPVRWAEIQAFRLLARKGRDKLKGSGLRTSDHFRGLALMDGLGAASLLTVLKALPAGRTELMCHPAEPDDELRAFSSGVDRRGQELRALCAPELRELLEREGIVLRSFRQGC
jgi:predicted glycoside hydrolase/deacetylase ChbG (UPF0249 family)